MLGSATSHSARAAEGRRRTAGRWSIDAGIALAIALVVTQVPANLIDFGVYDYRYSLINPNNEQGLFAWIGGVMIALAAVLCVVAARRGQHRAAYFVAAALLGIFAVENRVRFDEPTMHRAIVYVPLFGGLLAALVWVSWDWPLATRRLVWAGLAALLCSLALHKLAPYLLTQLGYGPGTWPWELKVSFKESSELIGWTLIATGLLAAALRVRRLSA